MKTNCIGLNTIPSCLLFVGIVAITFNPSAPAHASTLDNIGVTLLRSVTTNLNGEGIRVAQPEASLSTNSPVFQVNPAAIGQPVSLFTYYSIEGTSTNYPNSVGEESAHANGVAAILSGIPDGVATNVAHIDNHEADYFINTYIDSASPPDPGAPIVNQSFTFGALSTGVQQQVDQAFDDAAALHGTLFISGADNSGTVKAPATCYNGIGVGVIDGGSGIGPTPDNGRSKPDLVGFGGFTSASTPLVTGSAALLLQAALRGDGGDNTNAAGDMRTLKAFLLNGAVKPSGWTNGPSTPLDPRYGAGIVNVFNSYQQLAGGQHLAIEQTSVGLGAAHPPGPSAANLAQWSGWNFDTSLSSTMTQDRIKHYYFNLTNTATNATFTFTGTLVWNRQENQAAINDLDLLLYDTATSNVVAESTSFVNNVEHIYIRHLPPGRYDLQVWKAGGNAGNGRITSDETYALAWEFFAMPLHITPTGTNVVLTWSIYPTGFVLEFTPSLAPATWSTNLPAPIVMNGTNSVSLIATNDARFFRLRRP
jgi:hypothetical protein